MPSLWFGCFLNEDDQQIQSTTVHPDATTQEGTFRYVCVSHSYDIVLLDFSQAMLHSGRRQAKCFLSMIFLTTRRLYLSGACLKCAIHSFRDYFTLSQRHLASIPSKQCVMFASSCVALTMKWACKVQESRIRMSCIRHIVMCYMCHSHAVMQCHAVMQRHAMSCRQLCAFKIAKMSFPLQPFKARVARVTLGVWVPMCLLSSTLFNDV